MEILVFLMDEFSKENLQADQIDQLNEELIKAGYTTREINTAFSWLYKQVDDDEDRLQSIQIIDFNEPSSDSHRILDAIESKYIAPDAFGYLLQLKSLEMISAKEFEDVIERALLLDMHPITINEIKLIAQAVLMENAGKADDNIRLLNTSGTRDTVH